MSYTALQQDANKVAADLKVIFVWIETTGREASLLLDQERGLEREYRDAVRALDASKKQDVIDLFDHLVVAKGVITAKMKWLEVKGALTKVEVKLVQLKDQKRQLESMYNDLIKKMEGCSNNVLTLIKHGGRSQD